MRKILFFILLIYTIPQSAFSQIKYFKCITGVREHTILQSLTYGIEDKKIYYPMEVQHRNEPRFKDEWLIVNIDQASDIITAKSNSSEMKLYGYIRGKFSKGEGSMEMYYFKTGVKNYDTNCGFVRPGFVRP